MIQKFKRESDGKIFTCTFASHWSDIKAEDGEEDNVKWIGGSLGAEEYVSRVKGFRYIKLPVE